MCFHTKQTKSATEVENRFKAKIEDFSLFKSQIRINAFDFPLTPVIIDENPEQISFYQWGLIPSWAKNDEIKKFTLNAKIETINEKPSFKNSVNKRCLIIANGFYEWHWLDIKGKNKVKYEIGIGNDDLFAFAGLYSQWFDNNLNVLKNTYTLLTTQANEFMSHVHNSKKRMPVVLKKEDELKWLQQYPINEFAFPYDTYLGSKQEFIY